MKKAIGTDISIIVCRDTFKVVIRVEIPRSAYVPIERFVLANKYKITGEVRFKEINVIGSHLHRLKLFLVHGSQTLQSITVIVLTEFDA